MPQTKGAYELFKFQRGHIVSQCEGGLNQRRISKNLSIPLATVSKVIVKCARGGKKSLSLRPSMAIGPYYASW